MKRSILIGICALLGVATSMAQTYVVEGLYRDCAKASEHAPGESLMSRLSISAAFGEKEKEAMLPNGTEVTLLSDREILRAQTFGGAPPGPWQGEISILTALCKHRRAPSGARQRFFAGSARSLLTLRIV